MNTKAIANRPTKSKKRDHDTTNELAAEIILADITKHTDFQVRWAKAFTRRRAAESSAVDGNDRGGTEVDRTERDRQYSGQLPLYFHHV